MIIKKINIMISYIVAIINTHLKRNNIALTSLTQWVGHCPANRKAAVSIPAQSMCLGCGATSCVGGV